MTKKIIITGGAGFIGSHCVRACIARGDHVLNYDALTYAANPQTLIDLKENPQYHFTKGDIRDTNAISAAINDFKPDIIINFAAETHVDRSIDGPAVFVDTNVKGVQSLLDGCLVYMRSGDAPSDFRVIQVSTDEVFGSLDEQDPAFTEKSPYNPVSPYAASKAASDHLCLAYQRTYGLPVMITHCGNNYGPYQFPEKLIPHMVLCAINDKPMPIYGQGLNKRDWIYVTDHVDGILTIAEKGAIGERYLIGSQEEWKNIDLVRAICDTLDHLHPKPNGSYADQIVYVADRPGHDHRYALNTQKITTELQWQPKQDFHQGLSKTLAWYLQNLRWVDAALANGYEFKRLGTLL